MNWRLWVAAAPVIILPRLGVVLFYGADLAEPREDQFIFAELASSVAQGRGLALDPARFAAKAAAWRHPVLSEWVKDPSWAFGLVNVFGKTSAYEPLYPFSLGAAVKLGLSPWLAARLINFIFGVAAALAAATLAYRLFGEGAAVIAALAVAWYPPYVFYAARAMGETAHVGALATALATFYVGPRGLATSLAAAVAGAVFFLVRAIALPVILILLFLNGRRGYKFIFLFVVFFTLAIAPWVLRNYVVHGEWVLFPTRGGVNLWMRNNPDVLSLEEGELYADAAEIKKTLHREDLLSYPAFSYENEPARDRALRGRMLTFLNANKIYFLKMTGWRLYTTVRPFGPGAVSLWEKGAATLPYFLAVAFAFPGVVLAFKKRRTAGLALGVIFIFYVLYHAVIHGGVRYRIPADLCLLIYASGAAAVVAARARPMILRWVKGRR